MKSTKSQESQPASGSPKGQKTEQFLRIAVHQLMHLHGGEIVTLQEAAHRLYVPKTPRNKVGRMATAAEMKRVYERTKGQPFVLDCEFPGTPDPGPLFVWGSLWQFAGAPEEGEKPTWKFDPARDYIAITAACTPGRCLMRVRDQVAKFRSATSGAVIKRAA